MDPPHPVPEARLGDLDDALALNAVFAAVRVNASETPGVRIY